MDFLKKNYEKVLLAVVLVGLAVGAALLPWMIQSDREAEAAKALEIMNRPAKPLDPLNLTNVTELLQRAAAPLTLDFSSANKLFNPVAWQKQPDGTLKKVVRSGNLGVGALVVTKITPLYTRLSLDSVIPSESGARYMIGVERETAAKRTDRTKKTAGAALNEVKSKEGFVIREVKGPPENPTELILELTDTGERALLTRDKPYQRVDGYMADLKYPPADNKPWKEQRVGALLRNIAGDDYNVVAIGANEVVMSARSNNKKTSIPYNPGP